MIVADEILIALFNANNYSQTLENELVRKQNQGDDTCELEWRYILLGEWIRILQDFYNNNFDAEGQIVTPDYETITLAEAQLIVAQLKIAQGNNKYPLTNMFQLGLWMDSMGFIWDDTQTFYEVPELN